MTLLVASVQGHANIRRHLAFRDALRANAPLRTAYRAVKGACAARPDERGKGYCSRPSKWIAMAKAKALESYR